MSQQHSLPKQKMQPMVAWRALRRLIAEPEQTQEVFTVIRALSGPALQDGLARFSETQVGQRVLAEEIDLLDTLTDRKTLATLPQSSLGQQYLSFVTRESISADGLVVASEEDGEFAYIEGDLLRFAMRQRDMHDLWHTLTNYGRDALGEACLLAFTYAQTKNRGVGVICLAGCIKLSEIYGKGVFSAAWRAYKAGQRAAWLPGQDWEALLAKPIDEVRRQLNIEAPEAYIELRTEALAA